MLRNCDEGKILGNNCNNLSATFRGEGGGVVEKE